MLMKTKIFWLPAVAVALAMGACSSDNEPVVEPTLTIDPAEEVEFELTEAEKAVASNVLGFQTDFFRAVNALPENADQNVVVSPLSAQVLLSILANAAGENHTAEILEALNCKNLDALNSLAAKYQSALPNIDDAVNMELASTLWYNNLYAINPMPATKLEDVFGIHSHPADFANGLSVSSSFNNWIAANTNSLINSFLSPDDISPDQFAVMANAVYLKGEWANPFDKKETENELFSSFAGESTVQMMKKFFIQHISIHDDYSAVKLDFGSGQLNAIFVLPSESWDINAFANAFNVSQIGEFEDRLITFWLPKFSIDTQAIHLNKVLSNMGLASLDAYNPTVFFMEEIPVKFEVYQKTSICFDEKGAEGVSGNWDYPVGGVIRIPEVKLNRPFLFFINEASTGACIFAGKMVKF